jgi:hypothetical protein
VTSKIAVRSAGLPRFNPLKFDNHVILYILLLLAAGIGVMFLIFHLIWKSL